MLQHDIAQCTGICSITLDTPNELPEFNLLTQNLDCLDNGTIA